MNSGDSDTTKTLPIDLSRVMRLLTSGTIQDEHGMLRCSSNYTFLVSVADDELKTMAVYKPQRGERPLWDFPDGTLCYRETAAFVISNALNWQIVPPTVLRGGPRGTGSVQLYIQNNPEINYFSLDETYAEQLKRIAAFDYVINNADRKGGHVLLAGDGHLWGIDHGIGFHAAPKLRTVIWDFAGKPIPDDLLTDIERTYEDIEDDGSTLRKELDKLLADAEVNALLARMRRILQRREYPRPGPGPNYPWPPV
jgi:uncharacterized repeat protein (TIGR03843 family)